MKNQYITCIGLAILVMSFGGLGCTDWVQDIDPLASDIEDNALNDEQYVEFLLKGLQGAVAGQLDPDQFESGVPFMVLNTSWQTDEGFHYNNSFGEVDLDINNSWQDYHRMRWTAEDLIARINRIEMTNNALQEEALWWSNMVAGIIRMYLGDHWGWDADGSTPGAAISSEDEWGEFMSDKELHTAGRTYLNEALQYDPGDDAPGVGAGLADKIINSIIARSYLYEFDYAQAVSFAAEGLERGDQPFQILNTDTPYWLNNLLYNWLGRGFDGVPWIGQPGIVHHRFVWYVAGKPLGDGTIDPNFPGDRKEGVIISNLTEVDASSLSLRGPEGADGKPGHFARENPRIGLGNERLPLWEVLNEWGADYEDPLIYVGDLYPNKSDPVNVITWQEMELIRAEAALNPDPGFGSGYSGDVNQFLVHVNEVRDWHGLDPYTVDDALNYDNPDGGASTMNYIGVHNVNITGPKGLLIEERDKTLFLQAVRIVDLRRFGLFDTWPYIPIPGTEADRNPNLMDMPRNTGGL